MTALCPDSECFKLNPGPLSVRSVRIGSYYRRSDGQLIRRYRCRACFKTFSSARLSPCFFQKKRQINFKIAKLLNSGVSQRRAAIVLRTNRKTIVRKFRFLAEQARIKQSIFIQTLRPKSLEHIQFDDLETNEHSKCKPLSVCLAVEPKTRKILGFDVSRMPAKGPLAEIARRKYGHRVDERPMGWNRMFRGLKPLVSENALWRSDENPHYPRALRKHFPQANHIKHKGRRGCVVGQGELKRGGFDPLFSLNHTCAMLRANLNRLFRKTWCTTKTKQGLIDHLSLYVHYHNTSLTPPYTH